MQYVAKKWDGKMHYEPDIRSDATGENTRAVKVSTRTALHPTMLREIFYGSDSMVRSRVNRVAHAPQRNTVRLRKTK